MTPLWYIAVFCFLVSPSVRGQERQECLDAIQTFNNQGLELNSWKSKEGPIANIADPVACRSACCDKEDCDLAIVGLPQDGAPQCFLVGCMKDGKDVCRTRSLRDFTIYRKKSVGPKAEGRAADTINDNCTAPMVVGVCRASFPRFYYDGSACQNFTYGGCGGNGNNFETLEECNAACSGTSGAVVSNETPSAPAARKRMALPDNASSPEASVPVMTPELFKERCEAPVTVGPCRAAIPRYFYNHTEGNCQKFIYGGCRGNKNNYVSDKECYDTCSVNVIPNARKTPEENSTDGKSTSVPPADCMVEYDVGPCRASIRSFYFDSSTQSCLPFVYGGCQGNGNRFTSVAECMARCSGQEGTTEKHGPRSSRTPAHVMVGTLVVVTIVALVGLLVMLRRSSFRRRARDDKEELLPEDQLSTEQNA